MTQLSPSVMLYSQALAQFQEFKNDYAAGKLKNPEEVGAKINEIISNFITSSGSPLTRPENFAHGEPAVSSKFNRILQRMQDDVNILQEQLDVLRASSVFSHNYLATELMKAHYQNSETSNKVKTLQLYSNISDSNIIAFGDYFRSEEFIDWAAMNIGKRASLSSPGLLTLGKDTEDIDVLKDAEVEILPNSNGFQGNNQEVEDPASVQQNPTTGEAEIIFLAQANRHAEIEDIIDSEPNTWFEYESNWVNPEDRASVDDLNFTYTAGTQIIDWAKGPSNNVLKLNLQFDLGEAKVINTIKYTPYGLRDDRNNPIKIVSIRVSENGTDWTEIQPKNVWIGTDANLEAARVADTVTIGEATWMFSQKSVQFIRIDIEQPNSIAAKVGHLYWVNSETNLRALGPVPPITSPDKYYNMQNQAQGKLIQKREVFSGKRWAIGIRDIAVQQVKYVESSFMVSKLFKIPGIVDRVALEADLTIPPEFGSEELWVKFYVTPNDGLNSLCKPPL